MLDPNIFFNFRLYIVPGGTIENINKKNIGYLKSGLSVRTIKFYFVYYYYTGPKFFPTNDPRHNWIPISSFNAYSKHYGTNRIQYPIRLSYALTIHKSQGQTIEKAVIDLGKKEMSLGLTFVALSRLKNYKDFLIKPFTLPSRPFFSVNSMQILCILIVCTYMKLVPFSTFLHICKEYALAYM